MWNDSFEFFLGKCQSHGTMGVGVRETAAMKGKGEFGETAAMKGKGEFGECFRITIFSF